MVLRRFDGKTGCKSDAQKLLKEQLDSVPGLLKLPISDIFISGKLAQKQFNIGSDE
jgi:hypothetical protein